MYIKEFFVPKRHTRRSKCGVIHQYTRRCCVLVLRCDNCGNEFHRPRGRMDPNRINNNHFHVCKNCDSKKFAQKMGVTRKHIWDMPASSDLDISRL